MTLSMQLHAEYPCICMMSSHVLTWLMSCIYMTSLTVMHPHVSIKGEQKIYIFSKKCVFHVDAWHWLPYEYIDFLTVDPPIDLLSFMSEHTQNLFKKGPVLDQSTSYQTDHCSINSKLCYNYTFPAWKLYPWEPWSSCPTTARAYLHTE